MKTTQRTLMALLLTALAVQLTVTALLLTARARAADPQDEQVELKYIQYKPGQVQYLHLVSDSVGTMQLFGPTPQNMTQRIEQWVKYHCLGVDPDGVATVRLTLDRVACSMTLGPTTLSYDSAQKPDTRPANNPLAAAMGSIVGSTFEIRIDPHGKCLAVKGLDQAFSSLGKNVPALQQFADVAKSAFGEDFVKDNWLAYSSALPNKTVRVGDVWTSLGRVRLGSLGQKVVKNTYKLLGFQMLNGRRCARIAMTSTMQMTDADQPEDSTPPASTRPAAPFNMKMTGTSQAPGTGLFLWDYANGEVMQFKMSIPMELSAQMTNPVDPQQTITCTHKVTVSTLAETVDALPPAPTTEPAAPEQQ